MEAPTIQPDLFQRQAELEEEMRCIGINSYKKAIAEAKEQGRESGTSYGLDLLRNGVEPLAAGIVEYLKANAEKRKLTNPGAEPVAVAYLEAVDPHVAAFVTAKLVIDGISTRETLQSIVMRVATAIEDDCRFRAFEGSSKEHKAYFRKTRKNLEENISHEGIQRRKMVRAIRRAGEDWQGWPKNHKVQIGGRLIDLFAQATGWIDLVMHTEGRNNTTLYVELTEAAAALINGKNARSSLLHPQCLPTLIPPKAWTTPKWGGYHTKACKGLTLVKTRNPHYLEELANKDLTVVYGAINAMQRTAWRINTQVLDVIRDAWDNSSGVGGLPDREMTPLPTKPLDIATNKEARKAWRLDAHIVKIANVKLASKILQASKIISIAERFAPEKAIYFPYQLDFRGRAYAVPMMLNPQGPDHAKALLTFAEGKPVGDETGAQWLAIHGANVYGYDKVSLEDRVKWVDDHSDEIIESATDPMGCKFWLKADKPWQFLAWCFEWTGFLAEGYSFESSIPVALDGSCNGLQHFSAMLRDEVGGAAVNLTPSEKPQDIYQVVADRVTDKMKKLESELAKQWLSFGVTRKTTKRCVMVLPYGGTVYAFRQFVQEHIQERVLSGEANPFGSLDGFKAASFMAELIDVAIGETVISAVSAMKWLQEVARIVAGVGLPVNWTTPAGLPVQQVYWKLTSSRIKTAMFGRSIRLTLIDVNEEEGLDKRRQTNGISPNFVHSLDAAALMFCIVDAQIQGVDAFAMIHDSYATHAAKTQDLSVALRYAFVHQVYNEDVLLKFRDEVAQVLDDPSELPPLPPKGSLDISLVEQSDFFFA